MNTAMNTPIIVTLSLLFTMTTPVTANAQKIPRDFCSLVVEVVDERMRPVGGVPVSLVAKDESGSRTFDTTTDEMGVARKCDLTIATVSITVGVRNCLQSSIHGLPIFWGPNEVKLSFPRSRDTCFLDLPPLGRCRQILTVVEKDGAPIQEAIITVAQPLREATTDKYGRASVSLSIGETKRIRVSKSGYSDGVVEAVCDGSQWTRSLALILARK
jgi:hypothetical protein